MACPFDNGHENTVYPSDHLVIATIVNATGLCRSMPRCSNRLAAGGNRELAVRTFVVGHSRSGQAALRGDNAVDPPPRRHASRY